MAVINAVAMPSQTVANWSRSVLVLSSGGGVAAATLDAVTVVSGTTIQLDLSGPVVSDASWAEAANFTIVGGTREVTVVSAAPGGNPSATITLTTTGHTAGVTYTIYVSGLTNVTNGSSTYTGSDTNTSITAQQTAWETLEVVFSNPMEHTASLGSRSSYVLGGSLSVLGVNIRSSTRVQLRLSGNPITTTNTVTVNNLTDIFGNSVSGEADTYTVLTSSVTSVVAESIRKLRLVLDIPAKPNAEWADVSNFTVTRDSTGIPVAVASAAADSLAGGAIEVITSADMVAGQAYTVAWAGLRTVADGNAGVTAVVALPYAQTLTQIALNTLRLTFSVAMADNAALVNPSNYTFETGVTLGSVTRISATQVDISVSFATGVITGAVVVTGPQNVALTASCANSRKAFNRTIFVGG